MNVASHYILFRPFWSFLLSTAFFFFFPAKTLLFPKIRCSTAASPTLDAEFKLLLGHLFLISGVSEAELETCPALGLLGAGTSAVLLIPCLKIPRPWLRALHGPFLTEWLLKGLKVGVLLLIGVTILLQKGNNSQKKRSVCGKKCVLCGLDQGPPRLEVLVCV